MSITKTCLYNFDPIKPHFYIVKLGFTGVNIIFLSLLRNIDCVFKQKYENYQNFLPENFPFSVVKFSIFLNRRVYVMISGLAFKQYYTYLSLPKNIDDALCMCKRILSVFFFFYKIRIYHWCKVWIEKSVPRVTVCQWHYEASLPSDVRL